jgi:plastocyanin
VVRSLLSIAWLLGAACAGEFPAYVSKAQAAESPQPADGKVQTVLIDHFKYQPEILTVHVGDTVEWKNVDIVPHTVTAVDRKVFDSGRIVKGAAWRFTVTKKGAYDYACTLHPNMKAKLIAQ